MQKTEELAYAPDELDRAVENGSKRNSGCDYV